MKDSLFDPRLGPDDPERVVTVRERDRMKLYKVWLYVEGRDVPFIKTATYTLHLTFPNPVARSPYGYPLFELVIWTWGIFNVAAEVTDMTGQSHHFSHRMRYYKELEKGKIKHEYE